MSNETSSPRAFRLPFGLYAKYYEKAIVSEALATHTMSPSTRQFSQPWKPAINAYSTVLPKISIESILGLSWLISIRIYICPIKWGLILNARGGFWNLTKRSIIFLAFYYLFHTRIWLSQAGRQASNKHYPQRSFVIAFFHVSSLI